MDAPVIAAFASVAVAFVAILGLVGPVYLRQGRVEGEIKVTRERSDDQFGWARERSDAQYKELREWAEGQFRESRERSDAQHAETLREIRRLTDAFLSHSHAPDGGIIFRIPPPEGSTSPE